MKRLEKLKVLINSIKTANELMKKQIEINGRAVELLGEFITEPESLGKAPHSHNVPILSGFNIVGQEIESEIKGEYKEIPIGVVGKDGKVEPHIRPDAMYKDIHLLGGVPKDDKAPACLDGKLGAFIKPEDMKAWEWYFIETSSYRFLIKFNWIHNYQIIYFKGWSFYTNWYLSGIPLCNITDIKSIRKATQQEILKYFPNELEVFTHGGNDAAYIQEVTDPQI